MKFLSCLALASFFFIPFAHAASSCYSPAEAEAEQGLRIHSELMVIGLNCMGILNDPQLYTKYQRFTRQNESVITDWERTMMTYFSHTDGGSGEMPFHDFRTRMANQVSTDAARMRPDVFCHNYVGRLNKALGMSQEDLVRWAEMAYTNKPPSKPLCATASR